MKSTICYSEVSNLYVDLYLSGGNNYVKRQLFLSFNCVIVYKYIFFLVSLKSFWAETN